MDLTAIAQSAPGPIAVNASILVGYRLAGILGSFCTILGTILPPLIILSIISAGYTAFQENRILQLILRGMQAGVAAVIADVVCSMGAHVAKQKKAAPIVIMVCAFLAAQFLHVNVMLVIVACGLFGLLSHCWQARLGKKGGGAQ